jgi:hypothetical protein
MAVAAMHLFRNLVGDIDNPFIVELLSRGTATTSSGLQKPVINVYHFRRLTNGGVFDPADVCAVLAAAIQGDFLACLNQRYILTQWELHAMDDPASTTAVQPDGTHGGITTSDSYDLATAVYMLIRTGFRGRSFKGSKHYCPISEGDVVSDELTGDGLTHFGTLRATLQALKAGTLDTAGNTWFPIVLSRELSTLDTAPAIFTGADWDTVLLNKTVGTMSRRKEKTVR